MKKIVNFFKTSPLTRGDIILRMTVLTLLVSFVFFCIISELYANRPSVLGVLPITIILIGAALWGINPPVVEAWLKPNLSDNAKK